ncbi:putative ATP-dependent RNA helicase DHX37-like protein, partial [Leptotrombidium deliense]
MARKRNRSVAKKVVTDVEQRQQDEVQLQLDVDHSKYDDCNQLVITGDKKIQKKTTKGPVIQQNELSKKKKKKLQKILDRKDRAKDRKAIIEELKKYAVSSEHLSKLTSVCKAEKKRSKSETFDDFSKSNISSSQKRARVLESMEQTCSTSNLTKDLNVVGFDVLSEDDEEELDEATEHRQIITNVDNVDESKMLPTKSSDKLLESESKVGTSKEFESEVETSNNTKEACDIEKTDYMSVPRLHEVEKGRLQLPILAEEQIIMETVRYNPVVVICGETGSGKTTQVPQFLFEAGYARSAKICVTEPRRVAAISMSRRVAYEMNFSNNIVSYQIRFDGNINPETKICFVTDGILMREIQKDFLLSSFSVIIIDEAHERSLYSDILIGLLSRIIPLRYKKGSPLRLIIMSATLRVEDFTSNSNLFKVEPKILRVQSRQFSVTIHFSKKTPEDYVQEAYAKVCSIHRTFGDGGILVFVTGQQEVYQLCSKLRRTFAVKSTASVENNLSADNCREASKKKNVKHKQKKLNDLMPSINLDDYTPLSDEEEEMFNDETEKKSEEEHEVVESSCKPIYCRPLFAKLDEEKQSEIFTPPPEGSRLCVVATNIAETSLTIPGIKYVVDTGKVKVKVFDKLTGVSTMIVTWTSKASADQRAGRAGRTSNGHCFRLYSSAVFKEHFPQFSTPEIVSKPVDELFLQMK